MFCYSFYDCKNKVNNTLILEGYASLYCGGSLSSIPILEAIWRLGAVTLKREWLVCQSSQDACLRLGLGKSEIAFWVWLGEGLATPGYYDREKTTQPSCVVPLPTIALCEFAPITLITTALQNKNKKNPNRWSLRHSIFFCGEYLSFLQKLATRKSVIGLLKIFLPCWNTYIMYQL